MGTVNVLENIMGESKWTVYSDSGSNSIFTNAQGTSGAYNDYQTIASLTGNDNIKIVRSGTSLKVYQNNTEVISTPVTISNSFYIGFGCYNNANRSETFKDLKVTIS